ncbi:MAG: hypothetical protein P3T54_00235 [Dehalogenimonas sp.]|nr:hypothetical protein [Dehalogenimonas sp.]
MLKQFGANIRQESNVVITAFDLDGKVIDRVEFHNKVPTVALAMMRDALKGAITDCQIKRLAIGDGNTAPADGDVALENEILRKQITSSSEPSGTSYKTIVYVNPDEAVGAIEEIGWFAGASAGDDADSGILVSRVLYSRTKTAVESLQIERTDTFTEVV